MACRKEEGLIFVVSAPSGAGKSTIIKRAMALESNLQFSVSCTTRVPRPGEVDGVDYHFLSITEFEAKVQNAEFLEHAEFSGNRYGTLRQDVETVIASGRDLVLEIEVQGADQIRRQAQTGILADHTIFIFIAPPSMAELERRLRARGTDSEAAIRRRLARAWEEYEQKDKYDRIIVNDDLELAVAEFRAAMASARQEYCSNSADNSNGNRTGI